MVGMLLLHACDSYPHPYNTVLYIMPKDTLATEGIETHPGPTPSSTLDDPEGIDFGDEDMDEPLNYGNMQHCKEDDTNMETSDVMPDLVDTQPLIDHHSTCQTKMPKFTNTASAGCVLIEGINVSYLPKHWPFLYMREAIFMGIGEHSTTPEDMAICKGKLNETGWAFKDSCLDPELKHHTAGVAGIIRKPRKQQIPEPRDPEFAKLLKSGRCILLSAELGLTVPVICIVIYGWTGGRTNATARQRTDCLLAAAFRECACHHHGPCIIMGDVNDDISKLHCFDNICNNGWADLGAVSSTWGGIDNLGTCQPPNADSITRNDYIFVNEYVLPFVKKFYVEWDINIPTHAITGFELCITEQSSKVYKNIMPPSLFDTLRDTFFIAQAPPKEQDPTLMGDNDDLTPEDSNSTRKKWKAYIEPLQDKWTKLAKEHYAEFQRLLDCNDTDAAWLLFCKVLELGYTDFMGYKEEECKKHCGRGIPNLVKVDILGTRQATADHDGRIHLLPHDLRARTLHGQIARLQQWIARLKRLSNEPGHIGHAMLMLQLNIETVRSIRANLDLKEDTDTKVCGVLDLGQPNDKTQLWPLTALLKLWQKEYAQRIGLSKKLDNEATRTKVRNDKSFSKAFQLLRKPQAPPLQFMTRDIEGPMGQPPGSTATNPLEIDSIIRRAYDKIYKGNVKDLKAHAKDFISKYSDSLFRREEYLIDDMTGEELHMACITGPFTAGSMDGISPRDLSILPIQMFTLLASLLNTIEKGADWPKGMLHGKANFLHKDPDKPKNDPMEVRALLILSTVYRYWGKTRLRTLAPWIDEWKLDAIFAGVPGQGAQDAWYLMAMTFELNLLIGKIITGGAVDIKKAFDQINRILVSLILRLAGMPTRIIDAYMRFHDNLRVYNGIAGGFGMGYYKICSIPQGCPFSMLFMAILMRPLVILTEVPGKVIMRILADDVILVGIGHEYILLFTLKFHILLQYIIDMGSLISTGKSFLFSNDNPVRKWLRNYHWDIIGSSIKVVNNFRDLGAHLNLSGTNNGSTLTTRLTKGVTKTHSVNRLPFDYDTKTNFIEMSVLSGALYGCEATYASETHTGLLETAIANAVSPKASLRSNDIMFSIHKKEVQPDAAIFMRRVVMFRRALAKNPYLHESVGVIWRTYTRLEFPGTSFASICNIPCANAVSIRNWKQRFVPRGPVGLLLMSAAKFATYIDSSYSMHQQHEASFSIIGAPYQFLRCLTRTRICNARNTFISRDRTLFATSDPIDFDLLRSTLNSQKDADTRRIACWHATLSSVTNASLFKIGQHRDGKCECGAHSQDLDHLIWECPLTERLRHLNPLIEQLSRLNLPKPVRLGIPTLAHKHPGKDLWGCDSQSWESILQLFNIREKFGQVQIDAMQTFENIKNIDPTSFARNLFSIAKGDFGEIDLDPPLPCTKPAPDLPNVWPDGSVKHPSQPIWSLGGFGIVQENRLSTCDALHKNEDTFVRTQAKGGDLHLWGPLPGPMCSSTRTELAGGLISLYAPRASHIASDSWNFVRIAQKLFLGLPLPKVFDKPWSLIPNGDLWKLFFEHARIKGLHSLRATWVKGHATDKHVSDGIISEHNKFMNHVADGLADDGVSLYTSNLQPLAQAYSFRQYIYGRIIVAIQQFIVTVHLWAKERRECANKEVWTLNNQSHHFNAQLPCYSTLLCSRHVKVNVLPSSCVAGSLSMFHQCCNFLSKLRFAPLRGKSRDMSLPEQGTSWIELFILYELYGGGDGCMYSAAQPRPNLRQALLEFKRILSHIGHVCLRKGDRDFLAPAKVQICRLKPVGVDNFVPCINSCIHIEEEYKTLLLKALVSIRSRAATREVQQTAMVCDTPLAAQHRVTKGRMSYRGIPPWRSVQFTKFHQGRFTLSDLPPPRTSTSVKPHVFKLLCRSCEAPKNVANFTLLNKGKWHPLVCQTCALRCTARLWKCECKLPWTACQLHAELGFLCQAATRAKGKTQSRFLLATSAKRSDPLVPPTHRDKASKRRRAGPPLQKKETTPNASTGSDSKTGQKRTNTHISADAFSKSACLRKYFTCPTHAKAPVHSARKRKCEASVASNGSARLAVQRMREAAANPVDPHMASSSSLAVTSTIVTTEMSQRSPTNSGQTDATFPTHADPSHCVSGQGGNMYTRGKRKWKVPSIQVSKVKWGKPTPKPLLLFDARHPQPVTESLPYSGGPQQ